MRTFSIFWLSLFLGCGGPLPFCGDEVVQAGTEECDDGNQNTNDGCDSSCLREISQLSLGAFHSCALIANGNVRCWGAGGARLDYGNEDFIGDNETPALAGDVNVGGRVSQISAGGSHTCALLDTGNVHCWGESLFGRLGYGNLDNIGDNETPASAGDVNVGGSVRQISAGFDHSCVVLTTGEVLCWGQGRLGRLGYENEDNIGDEESPTFAGDVNVGGGAFQISAGGTHTCALLDTGIVRCWGFGIGGQLGYGNTDNIGDDETPVSAGNVLVF
jgi:cysteine-rich repeat protein